jgi:mannose-1-phosphate guanylyltransferase
MQALILAGGEGTRLRPLTETRPKAAIPLVDRPFISYALDWLARHGVTDVLIACGFGSDALRAALGEGRGPAPRLRYLEEPEPLGTAGPLRLAADEGLLEDRFLVLNGDLLSDLDLGALMRAHEESGAVVTLALHTVEDPSSYGLVRRRNGPEAPGETPTSPDGEVVEFLEKPNRGQIDTDEVNAGAYLVERRVVDLIPPGRMFSIEREVFPRLVGQGLYGHRLEGYWIDVGTPERYLEASWDILEGRVQTDLAARLDGAGLAVADDARIAPDARVEPPALLGAAASIEPGAIVGGRVVIGPKAAVGEGARVSGSVVLDACTVGSGAVIRDAILAPGVVVGAAAHVEAGSVIGEGARIERGARLAKGARIEPGATVQ